MPSHGSASAEHHEARRQHEQEPRSAVELDAQHGGAEAQRQQPLEHVRGGRHRVDGGVRRHREEQHTEEEAEAVPPVSAQQGTRGQRVGQLALGS